MHRAAYHFIKALGISSITKRKQKGRAKVKEWDDDNDGADDSDEEDEADVDVSMDIEASADDAEAMADTMMVDFELGDTLGKLLAFVNQVRVSCERVREYFVDCCGLQGVRPIHLRLWVGC